MILISPTDHFVFIYYYFLVRADFFICDSFLLDHIFEPVFGLLYQVCCHFLLTLNSFSLSISSLKFIVLSFNFTAWYILLNQIIRLYYSFILRNFSSSSIQRLTQSVVSSCIQLGVYGPVNTLWVFASAELTECEIVVDPRSRWCISI